MENQRSNKEVEIIPNSSKLDVLVSLPFSTFYSEHLLQLIMIYLEKLFIETLSVSPQTLMREKLCLFSPKWGIGECILN